MKKILIIRFSSIGDIIQCMSVIPSLREQFPDASIHWITRKDMSGLLRIDSRIDKIWEFERSKGFRGLIKMAFQLRKEGYTHVYDAHNNIRSVVLKLILTTFFLRRLVGLTKVVTRSKDRLKRILLFKFRVNLFPKPNRSFDSYAVPLKRWGVTSKSFAPQYQFTSDVVSRCEKLLQNRSNSSNPWITLVPSAAWPLKRWDIEYWQELVALLPHHNFVVLGGPSDSFCEKIVDVAPDRVLNLAGKTSLLDSFCIVSLSQLVISGDTGFLHAADLFSRPAIALIGPTAFGFPSGVNTKVLEVDLPCRPCTKDGSTKCKNKIDRQCLRDIKPQQVANMAQTMVK